VFGYDPNGFYGDTRDSETIQIVSKVTEYALFYTVSYRAQMWVNGTLIAEGPELKTKPTEEQVREWIRPEILERREQLGWLGVNVSSEYLKFGGRYSDLYNE
jgi:hypothetical protein